MYGTDRGFLVELFPARIRYSAMSLPYHIGNGWFGGFLPTTAFAMVAATGDIYYGLWYPIVIAAVSLGGGPAPSARNVQAGRRRLVLFNASRGAAACPMFARPAAFAR